MLGTTCFIVVIKVLRIFWKIKSIYYISSNPLLALCYFITKTIDYLIMFMLWNLHTIYVATAGPTIRITE